jgi:hypothetical protein
MANTSYTSIKLSYANAWNFKSAFSDYDRRHIKYVFLGNSNEYANNDTEIPEIYDTVVDEKTIWDTVYAGKQVTARDIELVVPRVNWESGTVYKQYDDTVLFESLVEASNSVQPMYVITEDLNVYKCLSNNKINVASTIKPNVDYTSSNGFVTTADGYVWKYLYNVRPTNKFLTSEWIPAPTEVSQLEYSSDVTNYVDGSIYSIYVTDVGSGYVDSEIEVDAFSSGCTQLQVSTTDNIAVNMAVTGTGILEGSYITEVDTIYNIVTITPQTAAAGGGTSNNISVTTRISVIGDGNDDIRATANIVNTTIDKITVTSRGTGYNFANVYIYGSGTGAEARAILAPKFGHGFNPARELGCSALMIATLIGSPDSSENGIISTNTSFRQVGLICNPHKYGNTTIVNPIDAVDVISQTTDISLVSGASYSLNEVVYQGDSLEASTFSAVVHAQDATTVRLINVKGTPTIGGLLIGNSVARAVISVENPFFQPYAGEILFVQNNLKTERTDGQAENVKFVLKF